MATPSQCARVWIIVVNIVFLVLGAILFAGGLFVRFGSAILNNIISAAITSLEKSLSSAGYGDIDLGSFSITDLLFWAAIGLICLGLLIVIITLLGCCGGCYKIRPCIIIYMVVCVIVLLAEVTIVVIFFAYTDVFDNPTKQMLKTNIQSEFKGINGTNLGSVGWNVIAQQMSCCGVDNYDDFTGASGWVVKYTSYTLKTPLACCKTLPDSSDFSCADVTTATDTNNYMNTGCYKKIKDLMFGNVAIMAGVLAGIGLFQILLIIFAVILCVSEKRNQVSPRSSAKPQETKQQWATRPKPNRNNRRPRNTEL